MADFKPQVGQAIQIGKETCTFMGYEGPVALKMAYAAQGKKGTVYRLRNSKGENFALKVFKPQYRVKRIWTINHVIKGAYESVPRVTIWRREIIRRPQYNELLELFPDLEYAVLMPWIAGDNWENYWGKNADAHRLTDQQCLEIARRLSETLWYIEQSQIAHCDLAGSNVMLDSKTLEPELIDLEDSYIPEIQPPTPRDIPAGTPGYQHRTSRSQGQWCEAGDRFAAAILLSEVLAWHVDEIRAAVGDGATAYFQDEDLAMPSVENARYRLLLDVIGTSSREITELLKTAWSAPRLEDCPPVRAWYKAVGNAKPAGSVPQILDTPRLIPVIYDKSGVPLFSWDPVSGAQHYQVGVAVDASFTQTRTFSVLGTNTYYEQLDGAHLLRVRAVAGRRQSAWSKPLLVGTLKRLNLSQVTIEGGTKLTWLSDPEATGYEIIIRGKVSEIHRLECSQRDSEEYIFDHKERLPGVYEISVRPLVELPGVNNRLEGPVSEPKTTLIRPNKPGKVKIYKNGFDVKLSWDAVRYAGSYRVGYALGGRSVSSVVQGAEFTTTLSPGIHQLEISALTDENVSSLSAHVQVEVEDLETPRVDAIAERAARTKLEWARVPHATSYEVLVEKDGKPIVSDALSTQNYYIFVHRKWKPGVYVARVRAKAQVQGLSQPVVSQYSGGVEVIVRPGKPAWQRKKIKVEGYDLTLVWNKVKAASKYRIYYQSLALPDEKFSIEEAIDNRTTLHLAAGCYSFQVCAWTNGIESEKTEPITLEIAAPTRLDTPQQITCQVSGYGTYVEWAPVPNGDEYEVTCSVSHMSGNPDDQTIFQTDATSIHVPYPFQYVRVRACSRTYNLVSEWSDVVSLPLFDLALPVPKMHKTTYSAPLDKSVDVEWSLTQLHYVLNNPVFEMEISGSSDFAQTTRERLSGFSKTLQADTRSIKYIRLRIMRDTHPGEWSAPCRVEFLPPAPKDLKLKASSRGVKVEWENVLEAEYEIQWDTEKSFSNPRTKHADAYTRLAVPSGTIYVRVRANIEGIWSKWSPTKSIVYCTPDLGHRRY